jgi:hypothetical protein
LPILPKLKTSKRTTSSSHALNNLLRYVFTLVFASFPDSFGLTFHSTSQPGLSLARDPTFPREEFIKKKRFRSERAQAAETTQKAQKHHQIAIKGTYSNTKLVLQSIRIFYLFFFICLAGKNHPSY